MPGRDALAPRVPDEPRRGVPRPCHRPRGHRRDRQDLRRPANAPPRRVRRTSTPAGLPIPDRSGRHGPCRFGTRGPRRRRLRGTGAVAGLDAARCGRSFRQRQLAGGTREHHGRRTEGPGRPKTTSPSGHPCWHRTCAIPTTTTVPKRCISSCRRGASSTATRAGSSRASAGRSTTSRTSSMPWHRMTRPCSPYGASGSGSLHRRKGR